MSGQQLQADVQATTITSSQQQHVSGLSLSVPSGGAGASVLDIIQTDEIQEEPPNTTTIIHDEVELKQGDYVFGFSVEPLSSSTPVRSSLVDIYSRRRSVSSPLTIQSSLDDRMTTSSNTPPRSVPNKNNRTTLYNRNDEDDQGVFRVGSPQSPPSLGPLLENVTTQFRSSQSTMTPRSNPSSDEYKHYSIAAFIAKYQERIKQQQNIWKDLFLNLRVYVWSGLLVFVLVMITMLFGFLSIFSARASRNIEKTKANSVGISGAVTLLNKMHKLESKLFEYGHNRAIYVNEKFQTLEERTQFISTLFSCPRLDVIGVDIVSVYNSTGGIEYLSACHDSKPIIPPQEIMTMPFDPVVHKLEFDTIKSGYINVESLITFVGTNITHANSTHLLMISVMRAVGTPFFLLFGRFITLDRLEPISSFTDSCITLFNTKNSVELDKLGVSLGTSFGNCTSVVTLMSEELDVRYQYGSTKVYLMGDVASVDILKSDSRVCIDDTENHSLISRGIRLVSYHVIPDFYGEYTVVLRQDIVRQYSIIIWSAYFLSMFVSFAMVALSFTALIVYIEIFIVRRVLILSKFVKSIIGSSDFTKRLKPNKNKDEIDELTFYINGMLNVLDSTQKRMEKDNQSIKNLLEKTSIEEQKSRSVMNSVPELVAFIDATDGTLICYNSSFETKLARKTRNSSQQNITQYLQDKVTIEDLIQRLEIMAISDTTWETCLISALSSLPVIVNTTKSKISNSNGKPVDTFVLVMKIVKQKKDLTKALCRRRTIDEMQTIQQFDNMFNNPTLLSMFRLFLEKEKSAENLAFLEAVYAYKSTSTTIDRGKQQEEIINKYLERTSNTYLNISQAVYDSEYDKIKNGYGQLDLFDKLENVVRHMVCTDSFKRFSDWSLRPSCGRWSDASIFNE